MLGILIAALMQAAPSTAAVVEPPLVTRPIWIRRPGAEEYAQTFPRETQTDGLAGQAVIECAVSEKGTLSECVTFSQDPSDGPFGAAALKAARYFKMQPKDAAGQQTAGRRIRIPLRWLISSGLASGPIRVKRPEFAGVEVDVDCRFRDGRLDNCLVLKSPPDSGAARDMALAIAKDLPMPKVSASSGRILLPLRFVAD